MPESMSDEEATALLRAAERSLFDATARLEQAMSAVGRRPPPDATAIIQMVEQARLWSKLIQAGLDRFGRTDRRACRVRPGHDPHGRHFRAAPRLNPDVVLVGRVRVWHARQVPMTDADTMKFVHQALFRAPLVDVSENVGEYLADAFYATAEHGPWAETMPRPFGSPDAGWLVSSSVKGWLADNELQIKNDLAMFVSATFQPVGGKAKPAPRGRRR